MQIRPVIHPYEMFFAQPTFRANVKEMAELPDYVLGRAPFPEAFVSREARDAALGGATEHVEFVPTTWSEAQAGGCVDGLIAVGHSPREDGFHVIAPYVLSAAVDQALGSKAGWGTIIIARFEYQFEVRDGTCGEVLVSPLYHVDSDSDGDDIDATAGWVLREVSNILSRKALA